MPRLFLAETLHRACFESNGFARNFFFNETIPLESIADHGGWDASLRLVGPRSCPATGYASLFVRPAIG